MQKQSSLLTFKCKLPCFKAHPCKGMQFASAPQRETDHPTREGIASLKSLWLPLKITSLETTTVSNSSIIGAIGRSQGRWGGTWIQHYSTGLPNGLWPWYVMRATCIPHTGLPIFHPQAAHILRFPQVLKYIFVTDQIPIFCTFIQINSLKIATWFLEFLFF